MATTRRGGEVQEWDVDLEPEGPSGSALSDTAAIGEVFDRPPERAPEQSRPVPRVSEPVHVAARPVTDPSVPMDDHLGRLFDTHDRLIRTVELFASSTGAIKQSVEEGNREVRHAGWRMREVADRFEGAIDSLAEQVRSVVSAAAAKKPRRAGLFGRFMRSLIYIGLALVAGFILAPRAESWLWENHPELAMQDWLKDIRGVPREMDVEPSGGYVIVDPESASRLIFPGRYCDGLETLCVPFVANREKLDAMTVTKNGGVVAFMPWTPYRNGMARRYQECGPNVSRVEECQARTQYYPPSIDPNYEKEG